MTDSLRMDYINSLPQPFFVKFGRHDQWWPVNDFEVSSGLLRIDVCGLLQVKSFAEVFQIQDGNWVQHDPETFWTDWTPEPTTTANSVGMETPEGVGMNPEKAIGATS